jgi:hypothetical protein
MFMFIRAVEFITIAILLTLLITEVAAPVIMGRPLFPMWRKKKAVEAAKLAAAKENLDIAGIRHRTKVVEKETTKKENKRV